MSNLSIRIKRYVKIHKKEEKDFAQLLLNIMSSDAILNFSSKEQDKFEHWDIETICNSVTKRYDVKGMKRISVKDPYPNEKIHFVEYVNGDGFLGWLYAGIPDFIVFETEKQWVVVNRKRLQKFMEEKCSVKIHCKNPTLYQFYTREKRKDEIVMVETDELKKIATKILDK